MSKHSRRVALTMKMYNGIYSWAAKSILKDGKIL